MKLFTVTHDSHTAPLNVTLRQKIFLSLRSTCSPDMKRGRGVGVGRQKRLLLGGQAGGSANKKKKSTLKIPGANTILNVDINSCPKIVGKILV